MPIVETIQLRRDTAANWTSVNPTLLEGEAGFETDTGLLKIGDGSTDWAALAYFDAGGGGGTTWYEGSGAPGGGTGVDGDFYLRTSNGDVYTKSSGSWGSPIANLTGPTGSTGSAGSNGSNGTNGATWRDGSGVPSNSLGANGDYYLDDATGNVYLRTAGTYSIVANIKGATGATGSAGAGTTGTTIQVPVPLDTPDASGNGYPALSTANGFSNVRRVVPAFTKGVDGSWEGAIRVPQNYASAGAILLAAVANQTASSKAVRWIVSTKVVAAGATEDGAYTAESAQNITLPTTANQRVDTTFTLSTTPVAGSTLNVKVTRQGSNGGDTATAVDVLLWEIVFQYVSA